MLSQLYDETFPDDGCATFDNCSMIREQTRDLHAMTLSSLERSVLGKVDSLRSITFSLNKTSRATLACAIKLGLDPRRTPSCVGNNNPSEQDALAPFRIPSFPLHAVTTD